MDMFERDRERQRRRIALAYIAPSVVCLLLIVGYPLAQSVLTSLYHWNLISGVRRWNGGQNYVTLFFDPLMRQVAVTTLVYTGLSVLIEFLLGTLLALVFRAGIRRQLPAFSGLRTLASLPILIAPLVWAFYFRSLYSPQFGAFNQFLAAIGLPPVLWVNDPSLAIYSLIFADVVQWTPFMAAIILAGLLGLPSDLAEAARVDGASETSIFLLIELPLVRPILVVAALLRTIDSIKNLDLVLVITQGGPGTSTEILNYFAYRTTFQEFLIGKGAALSLIVFAVILAAVALMLRMLRDSTGPAR